MNQPIHKRIASIKPQDSGFSLIELAAVIFIMSILAAVSVPKFKEIADSSKIDSVKAKLNSVAVSCLQELRAGSPPDSAINTNILSDELIKSDGYKISSDMRSCSSLMIESDNEDPFFFPMGFTISNGSLTKFAIPLSQNSESACKSWAGSNCKAGEELLDLIEHNQSVEAAKTACNENFYTWLNGNPPTVAVGDGKRNRWDPSADSACKRVPPANKGGTCTTTGCTLETWAFEGTIVAGEAGYKEALERKYGKICSEKLDKIRADKDTGGPVTILECGANKEMWFFEGVDQGSEALMNEAICQAETTKLENASNPPTTGIKTIPECGSKTFYFCNGEDKLTELLMEDCISKNEELVCSQALNNAKAENYSGSFIPKSNGPGICSKVFWLCEGTDVGSEADYLATTCGTPVCGDPPNFICVFSSNYNTPTCREWAECKGHI